MHALVKVSFGDYKVSINCKQWCKSLVQHFILCFQFLHLEFIQIDISPSLFLSRIRTAFLIHIIISLCPLFIRLSFSLLAIIFHVPFGFVSEIITRKKWSHTHAHISYLFGKRPRVLHVLLSTAYAQNSVISKFSSFLLFGLVFRFSLSLSLSHSSSHTRFRSRGLSRYE